MTTGLVDKVQQLHVAFRDADLPHAFGGALALAFCVHEPRTTRDIDLNVFVGTGRADEVLAALPAPVVVTDDNRLQLARDAQTRTRWDSTPVDLFLSDHPFHDHAAANCRVVPFEGITALPVLACADLAVFKAFFARPKDAIDVTGMVAAGAVDLDVLERTVQALLGDERRRFFERVREFLAEG